VRWARCAITLAFARGRTRAALIEVTPAVAMRTLSPFAASVAIARRLGYTSGRTGAGGGIGRTRGRTGAGGGIGRTRGRTGAGGGIGRTRGRTGAGGGIAAPSPSASSQNWPQIGPLECA
jgi:hypothetical protein